MGQVDNIDNISFSSAFVIDKIFPSAKVSGSFTVAATPSDLTPRITTQSLNNPIGENVLPIMIYSVDNVNWYDAGEVITETTTFGFPVAFRAASCYTTSSNIVVVGVNYDTTSFTLFYKIVLVSED